MNNRMKPVLFLLGVVLVFCFLRTPAEAAVSFTAVQTSPAELVMGTRPVTYRITNTSTNNEVINRIRFNLANNTYTSYPNPETFTAPAGWTCTRSSNTRVQCTGTMPTTPGLNYGDFTFNIKNVVTTYDRTDKLTTVQARFTGSNTQYNPNPLPTTGWTWKALEMTLAPAPTNIGYRMHDHTDHDRVEQVLGRQFGRCPCSITPDPRRRCGCQCSGAGTRQPYPGCQWWYRVHNLGLYRDRARRGYGEVYCLCEHDGDLCHESGRHKDLKQCDDRSGDHCCGCCMQPGLCDDHYADLSLFGGYHYSTDGCTEQDRRNGEQCNTECDHLHRACPDWLSSLHVVNRPDACEYESVD